MTGLVIAAVVVVVLVLAGWMMTRNRPTPESASTSTPIQASTVSLPTQGNAPAQSSRLGINAFPWANVTSIRNLDNGQNVAIAPSLVTPTPVDLAPGHYEVTLSNPQFREPITRKVEIEPGVDETLNVTFRDPASATLPDFGVTR